MTETRLANTFAERLAPAMRAVYGCAGSYAGEPILRWSCAAGHDEVTWRGGPGCWYCGARGAPI